MQSELEADKSSEESPTQWGPKGPKINREGQLCRHCPNRVIKRTHKADYKPKPGQKYFYEWWLQCPNPRCRAMYMVEDARRWIAEIPAVAESKSERQVYRDNS